MRLPGMNIVIGFVLASVALAHPGLLGASDTTSTERVTTPGLQVVLDSQGRMVSVQNRLTHQALPLRETIPFAATVNGHDLVPGSATRCGAEASVCYRLGALSATLSFRTAPDEVSIEKVLQLTNRGAAPVILDRILLERVDFDPHTIWIHPHRDPSVYAWLINVFVQGPHGGLFFGVENPFGRAQTMGGRVELYYRPHWRLNPGDTFTSEPAFWGTYQNAGIYAFREGRHLQVDRALPKTPGSTLSLRPEILDWGEIWGMQKFVAALEPPQTYARPGFFLRAVGPAHSVPEAEAFADKVAALGHIHMIEWNTFLAGKDPGSPAVWVGDKDGPLHFQPNPAWQQVVAYGRERGLSAGMMEAANNSYYASRPEWLALQPDGKPYPSKAACMADRSFIRWYAAQYAGMVRRYHLGLLAWDTPAWMWLQYPEPRYECFATDHGHPPGDVRYYVWRNLQYLFATLHAQFPDLPMRQAAGLQPGYPWILQNLIEFHNTFHDDEPGGTWWLSHNFRFIPSYKATSDMAAGNWAKLKYNFFRSLSLSDHAMIWGLPHSLSTTPTDLPGTPDQQSFFRHWMDWADGHIAYLRVRQDLFREPWGDEILNADHVDMEGTSKWSRPRIHGSAHCIGDRGYIFLFNPADQSRTAQIPIGGWIGLTQGTEFDVRVLFPASPRVYGTYRRDQRLRIGVPARNAMLLAIAPRSGPVVAAPDPPSGAPMDQAFYRWNEIPWRRIMARP